MSKPNATATVSVLVKVELPVAFEVFTQEIDQWWRHGPAYRRGRGESSTMCLEPGVHGRVFETWREGSAERSFEIGRIRVWEPPARFAFGWRNETFTPLQDTEVEVTFVAQSNGTLVTVRHSGFDTLPEDHAVRHGQDSRMFARELGLMWGKLMDALRQAAESR